VPGAAARGLRQMLHASALGHTESVVVYARAGLGRPGLPVAPAESGGCVCSDTLVFRFARVLRNSCANCG